MLTREPASFWRENVIAVIILLGVGANVVAGTSYQMRRSFIILLSGEGLTSFNIGNSAIFSNEKKVQ